MTATVSGRIVAEGMGGFLSPPTHPAHSFGVETDLRRKPENRGGMSLEHAAKCTYLNEKVRGRALQHLNQWKASDIDSPEIQDWVHQILGYFRNCYKGPQGDETAWHATNLRMNPDTTPNLNVDLHAGVHHIRKFYPGFTPTIENWANAYWGKR